MVKWRNSQIVNNGRIVKWKIGQTVVFLDSAYAIALFAVTDQYHKKAEILASQIETDAIQMITTRAVMVKLS